MVLGAIADDVTGATDLASVLRRAGCRVVLTFGAPRRAPPVVDAIVVATKARTAPVDEARAMVTESAEFLENAGADQLYFKYCSTFDSTDRGNIGPVIDLLLERRASDFTVACPAYPELGRTTYQGHLFVHDRLLSESSMRTHPLTPMHDPDLVRVLQRQAEARTGLIALPTVEAGPEAITRRIAVLRRQGVQAAVVDALYDRHIDALALACGSMPVVTGGAALGGALGKARIGRRPAGPDAPDAVRRSGNVVMLSGSCSTMTLAQVSRAVEAVPSYQLDPVRLISDPGALDEAVDWAVDRFRRGDLLIYSTSDPEAVRRSQSQLGRDDAAASLEHAFAVIARRLSEHGARDFVVAGGETSGAVTRALDVRMMTFGEELAPGVPWSIALDPEGYRLALKSGNFGDVDFFLKAVGRHG